MSGDHKITLKKNVIRYIKLDGACIDRFVTDSDNEIAVTIGDWVQRDGQFRSENEKEYKVNYGDLSWTETATVVNDIHERWEIYRAENFHYLLKPLFPSNEDLMNGYIGGGEHNYFHNEEDHNYLVELMLRTADFQLKDGEPFDICGESIIIDLKEGRYFPEREISDEKHERIVSYLYAEGFMGTKFHCSLKD